MPKRRVIKGHVRKLDPTTAYLPISEEDIAPQPVPLIAHFKKGRAILNPGDPEFARRRRILVASHHAGFPLYVEVDPKSSAIHTLLPSISGEVLSLHQKPPGRVTFLVGNSARLHILGKAHPKYHKYLRILREAYFKRQTVLVTVGQRGSGIVDISRSKGPARPAQPEIDVVAPAFQLTALRPVSPQRADEMYRLVAAESCKAASPAASCIPFLDPIDGCHARAHEMCRLIAAAGEYPIKIWNYSRSVRRRLVATTHNVPGCQVSWSFHVAVALAVQNEEQQEVRFLVLDPALFSRPVDAADWHARQGNLESCLLYTSPEPYMPPRVSRMESDQDFRNTRKELATRRLELHDMAGQIPFPCARAQSKSSRFPLYPGKQYIKIPGQMPTLTGPKRRIDRQIAQEASSAIATDIAKSVKKGPVAQQGQTVKTVKTPKKAQPKKKR
jgi:hypothetical protein